LMVAKHDEANYAAQHRARDIPQSHHAKQNARERDSHAHGSNKSARMMCDKVTEPPVPRPWKHWPARSWPTPLLVAETMDPMDSRFRASRKAGFLPTTLESSGKAGWMTVPARRRVVPMLKEATTLAPNSSPITCSVSVVGSGRSTFDRELELPAGLLRLRLHSSRL
jgi:hypothetical protein